MENDDSNSFNGNHSFQNEQDSNKSFVDKVKSRMTGILSSSFNKWFGNEGNISLIRRRDDNEEDLYQLQPPSKKIKKSQPGDDLNNVNSNSVPVRKDVNNLYKAAVSNSQNRAQNTFAKPIPGPSGIKSRKTLADAITCNLNNDDKDSDSGESTSGYSSMARISHKDVTHSGELKKVETTIQNVNSHSLFNTSNLSGHTRSLFTERSLSPQMNSSLSSRRPSFSASTFGSPNFVDRTLSTKRIISSPFYSGRTMYGGASAYNKRQKKLSDNYLSSTPQIEVKSVANAEETVNAPLSKTARRILETLEGFTSTTLLDVKKIPSPRKIETSGLLSKYTGANPYSIKDRKFTYSVPNKELLVPTIPDMLQMKRKEKLQNTTESVRKIAVASNSSLNNDGYKIRSVEDETSKHTNKFRHKISSVRHKPDNDNMVAEQVNLPNVTLPITNLPKFDFTLPLLPCVKPSGAVLVDIPSKTPQVSLSAKEPLINNIKETCVNQSEKLQTKIDSVEYKFSNPEVLAENLKAITAINDFKFSDPVFKKLDQLPIITSSTLLNFKSFEAPPLKLKKKLPNNQSIITSAPKLLTGSVEDVLNKNEKEPLNLLERFKPAAGMWECNTCLIRNLPDKQVCVSCTAPKCVSNTKKDGVVGFGDKFKMSSEQWECSVCMLRNDNLSNNCIACTTPRISNSKPTTSNVSTAPVVAKSFGNKFKPPKDTWECSTCMIRNQESAEKCIACETAKPGAIKKNNTALPAVGFGDLFQKKSNEWECSVCMVRNPNDKVKCLSCETPNPRASTSSNTELSQNTIPKKTPTFMFGIFPGSKTTGTGFKADEKSSSEAAAKSIPISSIFGNEKIGNLAATSKTASTYTFGIPKADEVVKKTNSDEKNQVSENKIAAPVSSITFNNKSGNITDSAKPLNSVKDSQEGTKNTYMFGSSGNTQSSKPLEKTENTNKVVNSEKANEKSTPSTTGFTFGSSIAPIDKEKSKIQLSGVTFGSSGSTTGKEKSAQPTGFSFGSSGPPTLKRSSNHADEHDSPASKRSLLPAPAFSPAQQIANDKNDADILKKAMSIGKESTKKGENNLFSSLATSNVSSGNTSNNTFGFMPSQSQPVLPTTTSENSNLFNFGSKTSTVEFGKTTSKDTSLFKIGNSNQVKLPENNKTTFDVTTAALSTVSSNVFTNTSASSVFGASSKPTFETTNSPSFETTLANSKPLFEAPGKTTFETTNKPLFKLDQTTFKTPNKITFDTPTKSMFDIPNKPMFDSPSGTSAFGSTTASSFGSSTSEIKPFTFGTSANENNAIKPSTFSFAPSTDSKVPEPSQPPPVFGFGSSVGTSSSSNTFSFNSTTSTPNSSFNFNSPKIDNSIAPFQSSAPTSTLFGSSSQAQPVQNGGFNFGSQSSSNAVKTGFNFGTAPPAPTQFNAQPAAASGGFSFGSSNQNNAQPATGGFNFGAMTAAPPTFNANITPAFNFTGGATPTFLAQPPPGDTLGPLTTRKKIKAVRRTHQR